MCVLVGSALAIHQWMCVCTQDTPPPNICFLAMKSFSGFYRVHTYRAATISVIMDYFIKIILATIPRFQPLKCEVLLFLAGPQRTSPKGRPEAE